jgi:hypothetical protein
VLKNKLPSELRLIASRKFRETDSWEFSALLKAQAGSDQPHVLLTRVDDLRNAQLALHCLSIPSHPPPHLNAVFVDKDNYHRLVEPSMELSLVERHSEGRGGTIFALERVTYLEIVGAESSVLAARDGIMLPSALVCVINEQKSQTLVLALERQSLSTLKPQPTILRRLPPCGPIRVNMWSFRLRRLLRSTQAAPQRHAEFKLCRILAASSHTLPTEHENSLPWLLLESTA